MVASKQGLVTVCQATEGASVEVLPRLPRRPKTHDSIEEPLGLGRTLHAQGIRNPSHPIRLGEYKGVKVLARSAILNHHLTISDNLRFHFSVCAFLQLRATYPASYEFRL